VWLFLATNSIPIPPLWPEALMIAFAIIYLLGANVGPDVAFAGSTRLRILSLAGLLAIAGLLFLGILSPHYAIVAVPTIPALALPSSCISTCSQSKNAQSDDLSEIVRRGVGAHLGISIVLGTS
jgi:hypothetical protein